MNGTVSWEFIFLFFNLAVGFVVGIFFDCYRLWRRSTKPGWLITQLTDLLFWVLAALMVFGCFFWVNRGEISLYTLLMVPLGMAIYLRKASHPVRKWLSFLFNCIGRAAAWFWWLLGSCLALLIYPCRFFIFFFHYTGLLLIGFLKITLLPLTLLLRFLRRLVKEGWRRLISSLKRLF